MNKKTFILVAIASCAWIAASLAATIPAGTTLVVQTIDAISSRAVVGRTFTARLDQDVAVNGKVVLRAGTKVLGKIEASRANPRNSKPLTVNLTGLSINGRTVPIKTVSGFREERGAFYGVSAWHNPRSTSNKDAVPPRETTELVIDIDFQLTASLRE